MWIRVSSAAIFTMPISLRWWAASRAASARSSSFKMTQETATARLDKKRLRERMGHVEEQVMEKVDTAIAVSFGLPHDQFV